MLKENKDCCACTACEKSCPKSAISMEENEQGFLYPVVKKERCVDCGLCEKVCSFQKFKSESKEPYAQLYGVKRKENRHLSQSGGVFSAIAEGFLKEKGLVYGVVNKGEQVYYQRVDMIEELAQMRRSKYVQAEIREVYLQVLSDLKNKKKVFFSGTPCHVDGLKGFLKQKQVNCDLLYTCDLVCHGTPSPKLFRDYLQLLEKKYKTIKNFNFRNKVLGGWHATLTTFQTGKTTMVSANYANLFYSHLELRESCYACPYACTKRTGDITIGDLWGIEKRHPKFDDNKGCSLLMLNTQKGYQLWEQYIAAFSYMELKLEDYLQPNLLHPIEKPESYEAFWDCYAAEGLEAAAKKYCEFDWKKDHILFYFQVRKYLHSIIRRCKKIFPIH